MINVSGVIESIEKCGPTNVKSFIVGMHCGWTWWEENVLNSLNIVYVSLNVWFTLLWKPFVEGMIFSLRKYIAIMTPPSQIDCLDINIKLVTSQSSLLNSLDF